MRPWSSSFVLGDAARSFPMDWPLAYSLFDGLFPALLGLALVAVPAYALAPLLQLMASERRSLRFGASLGAALSGACIGFACVGPSLVNEKQYAAALAGGALGAAIAWQRHPSKMETLRPLVIVLAFLVATLPLIGWAVLRELTTLEDAQHTSAARADRRRWVAPWDDKAHVALAWAALRREDGERAEALRQVALRADLDRASNHELLAELRTLAGDCEGAREAFDEALRARANSAIETFDLRLDDSYRLPERFVRECGLHGTTLPDGAPE